MEARRRETKHTLLEETFGPVVCPCCAIFRSGQPAHLGIRLHEICAPPMVKKRDGSKYYAHVDSVLADVLFVPENCILLCDVCNGVWANGYDKALMLAVKMSLKYYPPEVVIPKIQAIAAQVKIAVSWLPRSVTVNGTTYTILE